MTRIRWSPGAAQSFEDALIWLKDRTPAGARQMRLEVLRRLRLQAEFPYSAPEGPLPGSRALVLPRWKKVVVYRVSSSGLDVLSFRDAPQEPLQDNKS